MDDEDFVKYIHSRFLEKFAKLDATRPSEENIQSLFGPYMMELCRNLQFWDTSSCASIIPPQKPDYSVTLAEHALCPSTVLALVELKRGGGKIDSTARGQVISGLNRLLEKQVVPQKLLGLSTNGTKFFLCSLDDNGMSIAKNANIFTVVSYFRRLTCEIQFPKFDDDMGCEYVFSGLLGKGKTSEVFLVEKGNSNYALKVAFPGFEWAIKQEQDVLQKLDCSNFQKVLWSGWVSHQGLRRFSVLLSPVASCGSFTFTKQDICDISNGLHSLHNLGYVHCDISHHNLGHVEYPNHDGSSVIVPLLRDFGFCRMGKLSSPYCGSLSTASSRVLNILKNGVFDFIMLPADDYESLFKSIYIIVTKRSPLVQKSPKVPDSQTFTDLLSWWETELGAWRDDIELACSEAPQSFHKFHLLFSLLSTRSSSDLMSQGSSISPLKYKKEFDESSSIPLPPSPPRETMTSIMSASTPLSSQLHESAPSPVNCSRLRRSARIQDQKNLNKLQNPSLN